MHTISNVSSSDPFVGVSYSDGVEIDREVDREVNRDLGPLLVDHTVFAQLSDHDLLDQVEVGP